MEHESLEFKITMADDLDTKVLARTAALDIASATYMAAIARYPRPSIQFRHRARIIERHDGEPPPPPIEPRDPNLSPWSGHLIGAKKDGPVGRHRGVGRAGRGHAGRGALQPGR
jgi:hypothetical protein